MKFVGDEIVPIASMAAGEMLVTRRGLGLPPDVEARFDAGLATPEDYRITKARLSFINSQLIDAEVGVARPS